MSHLSGTFGTYNSKEPMVYLRTKNRAIAILLLRVLEIWTKNKYFFVCLLDDCWIALKFSKNESVDMSEADPPWQFADDR